MKMRVVMIMVGMVWLGMSINPTLAQNDTTSTTASCWAEVLSSCGNTSTTAELNVCCTSMKAVVKDTTCFCSIQSSLDADTIDAFNIIFTYCKITESFDSVCGSTSPANNGTSPSDDGTSPADDGTSPADDGTSPVDDGTSPVDDGTSPVDDGTSPTDDGTSPADDGTSPVDDGTPSTASPGLSKTSPTKSTSETTTDSNPSSDGPSFPGGSKASTGSKITTKSLFSFLTVIMLSWMIIKGL